MSRCIGRKIVETNGIVRLVRRDENGVSGILVLKGGLNAVATRSLLVFRSKARRIRWTELMLAVEVMVQIQKAISSAYEPRICRL